LKGRRATERLVALLVALLSLPIPSKGLGGIVTTGEVTGSPVSASDCSLLSRHGSRAKGADLPPSSPVQLLLFLLFHLLLLLLLLLRFLRSLLFAK